MKGVQRIVFTFLCVWVMVISPLTASTTLVPYLSLENFTVTVVDKDGRPVANALVEIEYQGKTSGTNDAKTRVITGENGMAVAVLLHTIPPDINVPKRVRLFYPACFEDKPRQEKLRVQPCTHYGGCIKEKKADETNETNKEPFCAYIAGSTMFCMNNSGRVSCEGWENAPIRQDMVMETKETKASSIVFTVPRTMLTVSTNRGAVVRVGTTTLLAREGEASFLLPIGTHTVFVSYGVKNTSQTITLYNRTVMSVYLAQPVALNITNEGGKPIPVTVTLEMGQQLVYGPTHVETALDTVTIQFENRTKNVSTRDGRAVFDLSPPRITHVEIGEPTPSGTANVSVIVSDEGLYASGVANVSVLLNGTLIPLTKKGAEYEGSLTLLPGSNEFSIVAYDNEGNRAQTASYVISYKKPLPQENPLLQEFFIVFLALGVVVFAYFYFSDVYPRAA